ncbi:class I SAM-dependent methyltransferase [Actinopolymorpha pittospori]
MPHYTHSLAWLLGLEGVALLRAQAGDDVGQHPNAPDSPDFIEARIAEIRSLVADPELLARPGGTVGHATTRDGYSIWAETYDDPGNPLIEVEEPVVRPLLDALPVARVLDAACGTGRHAAYLHTLGHEVAGVDGSPEMLAHARLKVPAGEFKEGALDALPFPDASFDTVVCALALTHQPRLEPVLTEFARVLRPGGQAILSDIHWLSLYLGGVASVSGPEGTRALPATRFLPSDYLTAALAAGFAVVSCREPRWGDRAGGHGGTDAQRYCPEAVRAACRDTPALIVWQLRK